MTLWSVRGTPDRTDRFRALVGVIVSCSWARHFNLIVPPFTRVYKWVREVRERLMLGITLHAIQARGGGGGRTDTPGHFMQRKPEQGTKLWATWHDILHIVKRHKC